MKNFIKYILLFIFVIFSYNAYSQIDSIRKITPVLKVVSIQPETGYAELSWEAAYSPFIAGYKILYFDKDFGGFFRFKTLWNPLLKTYIDSSRISRYFSVSYAIEAIDIAENPSKISNSINTIYTTAAIDTCSKRITISWNSYTPFPLNISGYSVLASLNGSAYTVVSNVSSEQKSFTLNDFATNSEYCFVVRANLENGALSTSNKACLLTKMQRPPQWINADYATVSAEKKIDLSFTIDPKSEIINFKLYRKSGQTDAFQEIAQAVSVSNSVKYTDGKAKNDSIYTYRLTAINNCNNPATSSNTASNIALSLKRNGNDIDLKWNGYKNWLGNVSGYHLFINTGKGFEEKTEFLTSDTSITLGYNEIMYDVSGGYVCFYISASESSNPYGISGQSKSSLVCTEPTEIITVPNIFTPNNDLVNDYFRPVLSFTPVTYHLVISDRQGSILFETNNFQAEWDGSQNNRKQPQGVYLWFLKITTPSGNVMSKTGTVTIINK